MPHVVFDSLLDGMKGNESETHGREDKGGEVSDTSVNGEMNKSKKYYYINILDGKLACSYV